jgi:hypothetical protein
VGLLVTPPVAVAVITGLPAVESLYQKLALLEFVAMLEAVIWCEPLQLERFQNVPPELLLLRATFTVLRGSAGLLFASSVVTVTGEQLPTVTLRDAVVNASLLAPNVTVAVCVTVTLSVVSLPVYTTACAVESFTVKVA